eukprot:TRINITY_DN42262_c0_g1_i1.p1 TRINITY_DN42262_c0_g1~~TRINITY_DN42262_c0_g1_i1.p1  ORF type:complete len:112 (+),score=34.60 TRINITY_DN42262_c0_g1_i1:146-481(+)
MCIRDRPNNFNYVATPKALVSGLEIGAAVGGVAHSGGTSQPSDVPKPYSMVQSHGGLSSLNLDSSRGGSGSGKGGSSSTLATRTSVSYTHLRAHETPEHLVCRLLLEKKKK